MGRAAILAVFAGAAAYFTLPLFVRLGHLLFDLWRHPLKVTQLTRVTVAYADLCRRQPDITQAPEFGQACLEMARQLCGEAIDAGYPLSAPEVINAILLGIQDSGAVSSEGLRTLEGRLMRQVNPRARALN